MNEPPMPAPLTPPGSSRRLTPTRRVLAVVAVALLGVGGVTYLTTRDDSSPPPRLALRTPAANPGSDNAAQAEASMRALANNVTTRYVVDGTLDGLPTRASVARVESDALPATRVAQWARTLGISQAPTDDRTGPLDSWRAVGDDATLTASNTGRTWFVEYHRGSASASSPVESPGATPGSTPGSDPGSDSVAPTPTPPPPSVDLRPAQLPDAAAVRQIGMKTLDDLGVLEGAEWKFSVRDGGTVGVASACLVGQACDQTETSYTLSRQFVATRLVDGHVVDGLDWTVDLGDGGRIENLTGTIASTRTVGEYPLRSVTDAVASLRDGNSGGPIPTGAAEADLAPAPCPPSEACPPPRVVTITITGVELGRALWFGGEGSAPFEYLVPTLHFTGHDESGQPWSADVLGLTDAALVAPPTTTTSPAVSTPAAGGE